VSFSGSVKKATSKPDAPKLCYSANPFLEISEPPQIQNVFFFLSRLFNNGTSSNGGTTVNDELKGMWKEEDVLSFKVTQFVLLSAWRNAASH
jgi:hypothetical protein